MQESYNLFTVMSEKLSMSYSENHIDFLCLCWLLYLSLSNVYFILFFCFLFSFGLFQNCYHNTLIDYHL